jgi:dipeptidyl aminopeptidase/acylaminoacyl peptidase
VVTRFHFIAITGPLLIAASLSTATARSAPRELTTQDSIATTRLMRNQSQPGQTSSNDLTSPDGHRYLIRLVHGDVRRNGVWMDLLTGTLDSLEAATHPRRCASLFTTGLGSTTSAKAAQADVDTTNLVTWLDNDRVAFLWSDPHAVRQILEVNLATCKQEFITHAAADVFSFAGGRSGVRRGTPTGPLVYNMQVPQPSDLAAKLWSRGFTVSDRSDAISILEGYIGDESALDWQYKSSWFIRSGLHLQPLIFDGKTEDHTNGYGRDLSLGPNGRYAIASYGPASSPATWQQYTNQALTQVLASHDSVRYPVRYAVIDLKNATTHMLWNAPMSTKGKALWSPRDESVLLAPTYLPLETQSPAGLSGTAAAEVDVRNGQFHVLPVDLTDRSVLQARWLSPDTIELTTSASMSTDQITQRFGRITGEWKVIPTTDASESSPLHSPAISVEVRQSLNEPPKVFAVDARSGQSRLIVDPNPHLLEDFKLGRTERLSGTLPTGQSWIAQLIYPADYQVGIRYPLLIQTLYGAEFGTEEFSLQGSWIAGMGLGPTDVATYPGQLLATRNVAVLQLEELHAGRGVEQAENHKVVYEALARQLVASGLADEHKIALAGFSQNGYWVEYTLAHSDFPFAAAIAADNYDPSYMQSALGNWREMDERLNGGPAFGEGLTQWLQHAPGFNAEHIHTPLLMTGQDGGVLLIIGKWETYSRLHHLHKPVQMYIMPRADQHPAHIPQNPQQIIGLQETALDWLDFWLTGREDPSPDKREQYARWRAFRTPQTTADLQSAKSP